MATAFQNFYQNQLSSFNIVTNSSTDTYISSVFATVPQSELWQIQFLSANFQITSLFVANFAPGVTSTTYALHSLNEISDKIYFAFNAPLEIDKNNNGASNVSCNFFENNQLRFWLRSTATPRTVTINYRILKYKNTNY